MSRFLTRRRLFWIFFPFSAVSAAALMTVPFGPPNDPLYAPACGPFPPCTAPPGQWNLRSDVRTVPATAHPSGISVDLAWTLSAGRPDVTAVVFDSGVNYDHVDLRNQIWLNCGELPAPNNAGVTTAGSSPNCRNTSLKYDINNDGLFSIQDYATDNRITDTILTGVRSRSDLRVFENSTDDDGNGYVDDISGYDFDDDDADEYDHRDFGHGTGRNGFIAAEANNGMGIAGICPNCRIANARIDDTYVSRTEGTANAMVWVADHGHELVTMALGHTTSSSMSRAAFDYGTRNNVLAFSAIANEFHFHQGYVGVYDDVVAIGAVTYSPGPNAAGPSPFAPTSYLRKANFSNYGAHLEVVTPTDSLTTTHGSDNSLEGFSNSTGTSSAVPHAVGTAALIISYARDRIAASALNATGLALPELSAQEVRQILSRTADDVTPSDDAGGYATTAGWDKYTGYGRINAKKALDRITAGRIPPETDINSPDWYSYNDPGTVTVQFYANNRWRGDYTWKLEVGAGLAPSSFTQIDSGSGARDLSRSSASMVNNHSAAWTTPVVTSMTAYTLRLTVTDNTDPTNVGEDRMAIYVRPADTTAAADHAGWPKRLLNNGVPISAESLSTALVDLDGDNKLEIILSGSGDGRLFAYRENGALMAGFPVMTNPPLGLPTPLAASPAFDGSAANGEVPVTGASVIGGPVVGDMDRDGLQELCVGAYDGRVYCWKSDGSVQPGFPVSIDLGQTRSQYPPNTFSNNLRGEAIISPPVLRNLDGDAAGTLEIVVPAMDQKLYAWHANGARVTNFPLTMFDATQAGADPTTQKRPKGAIATPIIANIDNSADGSMEIVAATNEGYGSTPNGSGRIYAFSADGSLLPGWPVAPGSLSPDALPIVAQGVGTGPIAADVDNNGDLEIIGIAFLGDPTLYQHTGGSATRTYAGTVAGGTASDTNEETAQGGLGPAADSPSRGYVGMPALGDVGSDGTLDYLNGSVGNGLVVNTVQGTGSITNFEFYLSSWRANDGAVNASFPRVLEGWQFFTAPIVADLDGDNKRDVVITSSGNFVHAFNASGADLSGWPKRTGHWSLSTPSASDIDDDGDLEVVVADRMGYVQVWNTPGGACSNQWRKYRHDEWNTGTLGTDTLRPAKVDSLSGTPSGSAVNLNWTAVGDDHRCGTATAYELRRSGSPITEANFASAQVVSGLGAPKASGQSESFSVPQSGGAYLALRVVDEAGNRSPISPVVLTQLVLNTVTGTAANPSGAAGQTVTVGSFILTNGSPRAHSVSELRFTASRSEVLSSLTITGGGATFACTRQSTGFNCTANPAASVPANGSTSFTVQAQIAAPATAALSQTPTVMLAGTSALGGLMLLGLAGVRRRSLLWLLPIVLALSMLQGCGSSGSSDDDNGNPPTPSPSANSTTLSLIGITASDSLGTVSYGGLPVSLGTVTRSP